MKKADMILLFDYNYWANKRILEQAKRCSLEQLTAPNTFSWGSLRGTLVHTLDAEYGWRMALGKLGSSPVLEPENYPDVASIEEHWQAEEAAMRTFLDSLDDVGLAAKFYFGEKGDDENAQVLWHYLLHMVNHGTQHRSECAVMLTDYGHSPGDIDFTVFLNE